MFSSVILGMQKRLANNYFNFTKKERTGTIFLLLIIGLISLIPIFYPLVFPAKLNIVEVEEAISELKAKVKDSSFANDQKAFRNYASTKKTYYRNAERIDASSIEYFNFDPNTLSAAGWKKLGLKERTIQTIQNFLSKGGRFKEAADIKKIWGLHPDETERLIPFIKIESATMEKSKAEFSTPSNKYPASRKTLDPIEINLADTAAFSHLPGIGSKLSKRIIDFREKLGGFYSIDQVAETFGLADSVFQKIRPALKISKTGIKQININEATIDDLKLHPYIRYNLANIIVQFRNQHGNFISVEGLRKIMMIDEALYSRLLPYLTVK